MKTAKQYMLESLEAFGKLFQLPDPTPEYLETIQMALRSHKWKLSQFINALNALTQDERYAEASRFGKYPTIYDYLRIDRQIRSKNFYDALSSYLSGNWWKREIVLELATPAQMNAIESAGGLKKLYERANNDLPTPVYKLVDVVAQNESEAPTKTITTAMRIGAIKPIKQIMQQPVS